MLAVPIIEEQIFEELPSVVEAILLDGVEAGDVPGDHWKEGRGEGSRDDLVNILKLGLLDIELVNADFVHIIILNEEYAVGEAVDRAQAQGSVVGLQDDFA